MQLLTNIVISLSQYLLIAYSFVLIYGTTKYFNIAHAIYITIGAYVVYWGINDLSIPLLVSIALSIGITMGIAILLEKCVWGPIKTKGASAMSLMIISLGLYIVFQNCISLLWRDLSLSIRSTEIQTGYNIGGGRITIVQIISALITLGLFIIVNCIIKKSRIGQKIRSVSENSDLSTIMGIDPAQTILWASAIGSALAGVAGVLYAYDVDMTPTMGFDLLLYGVVAMIIGGVGNSWGLAGGALLLSSAQHLSAYYIGSEWMNAVAYILLIVFLLFRPQGFSGNRLKKVEL